MNWSRSLRFWSNTVRKCIGEACCGRSSPWPVQRIASRYRHFGRRVENDDYPLLDRSFLVQLWEADGKLEGSRGKRKRILTRHGNKNRIANYNDRNLVFERPFGKSTSDATFAEGKSWKQPPPSQSVSGFLEPHSPEERSLSLSRNHLSGIIPERISVMNDLESLDLSRNQLSGRIPSSMSNLSFLNHLNLSYNNLSGAIPTSTQLQGFNPFSFIGNQLCGPPINNSCGMEGVIPETRNEDAKEGDRSYIDGWFYLSLAMGFVFGFGGIWGPLLVSNTWRVKYFRYLASIWHKLK